MSKFSGVSPSHLACRNGHLNVMKVLASFNCLTFRDPDINGISSLTYASLNGHTEIVNLYRDLEENFIKKKELQMKLLKKFNHFSYGEEYVCNFVNLFRCNPSKCSKALCDGHILNPEYKMPDDYIENVEFLFLYSTDSEDDDEEVPTAKKIRKFSITVL